MCHVSPEEITAEIRYRQEECRRIPLAYGSSILKRVVVWAKAIKPKPAPRPAGAE